MCPRFHYSEFEQQNPEPKPRGGLGMKQRGPDGKEEESQAWLSMLEKATNSVRYISRHIKKEHFIREVCSDSERVRVWRRGRSCGTVYSSRWFLCVL